MYRSDKYRIGLALMPSVLVLLTLSSSASAQRCGTYGVGVHVKDKFGRAVKDAQVTVTPPLKVIKASMGEFRTSAEMPGYFYLFLLEHDLILGEYELRIEAPRFKAYSQKTRFTHCERQAIDIKLDKRRERLPRRRFGRGVVKLPIS
jgi:hypothetical protein